MRSKKAIYNILSNLLLQIVIVIYGFIVPKIIISKFGSEVNGLISSITQFLMYISLLESGFGPVVKSALYKPKDKKDNKEILNILKTSERFFKRISYIFLVYIILLCVLYPIIVSNNFGYIYTVSLIVIISISTFAEYYFGMTYKLYLQAKQKNYVISTIQIVTYVISVFFIVILTRLNTNVQMIKLSSAIIFVFRPLFQNFYVKKKYNIYLNNVDSGYKLKQKWDGLAQHIASVIHSNTDITILTIFSTLSEVSVYSVYYLVIKGIKSIVQAFCSGIDSSFGDMLAKDEHKNLNRKFNLYEVMYFTITTIIFTCTLILITPFISVYMQGISDANYIRYIFGYLLVISEYVCMIRIPYISVTYAAGHFKETRNGAWIEAASNIVISILLVWKFGIIGVTIGTIVAMTIRTIEFIYHTNKYILKRNIFESVKKILLIIIETVAIVFICRYVPFLMNVNYINWLINAIIVGLVSSVIVIMINIIFYKEYMKMFLNVIKKNIKNKDK